jgi:hypothetical protein
MRCTEASGTLVAQDFSPVLQGRLWLNDAGTDEQN